MTRILNSIILNCALTSFGVACSSAPPSPSPEQSPRVPVDQLSGTWNLVSLQPTGEPQQATPAGLAYTLTFNGGQFAMRGECNMCNGTFVLTGGAPMTRPPPRGTPLPGPE